MNVINKSVFYLYTDWPYVYFTNNYYKILLQLLNKDFRCVKYLIIII